jgi:hypothetical protein
MLNKKINKIYPLTFVKGYGSGYRISNKKVGDSTTGVIAYGSNILSSIEL